MALPQSQIKRRDRVIVPRTGGQTRSIAGLAIDDMLERLARLEAHDLAFDMAQQRTDIGGGGGMREPAARPVHEARAGH